MQMKVTEKASGTFITIKHSGSGYSVGDHIPGVVATLQKPFDLVELELELKRIEKSLETK